jgi:hypothetical protein
MEDRMNKISFLLIFVFIIAGCSTNKESINSSENKQPDFNGIYYYETEGYTTYLRFYPDGNVISLTSIGKYNNDVLINWSIEYYSDAIGKYQIHNGNITFEIITAGGSIEYSGSVKNEYLILNSHSNINNHEEKNIRYKFHKFILKQIE